ncbi:hypothetical protein HY642_07070 [Candidatus Woesearchaeota archaeon]|nr:hypothetical protein [Candidatus Woesearchaeota archaeon]
MTEYTIRLLQILDAAWKNVRLFAYENRTVFELLFILLYSLEQAGLVLLTYWSPQDSALIISVFALAVLTTFSLHKLVMESRIRLLEKEVAQLQGDINVLAVEAAKINERYNRLESHVRPGKFKYRTVEPVNTR